MTDIRERAEQIVADTLRTPHATSPALVASDVLDDLGSAGLSVVETWTTDPGAVMVDQAVTEYLDEQLDPDGAAGERYRRVEFVRFVETNDHEGETWAHWLQASGNEDELGKLAALLAATTEPVSEFELHLDKREPQFVVDKLVEYAESGYMASHTKVVGVLTCPDDLWEGAERLYKGGVADLFTKPEGDA